MFFILAVLSITKKQVLSPVLLESFPCNHPPDVYEANLILRLRAGQVVCSPIPPSVGSSLRAVSTGNASASWPGDALGASGVLHFSRRAPGSSSSRSSPGWHLPMPHACTQCPRLPSGVWALWDLDVVALVTLQTPSCSFLFARHPQQASFWASLCFLKLPERIPSQHSQCICLGFWGALIPGMSLNCSTWALNGAPFKAGAKQSVETMIIWGHVGPRSSLLPSHCLQACDISLFNKSLRWAQPQKSKLGPEKPVRCISFSSSYHQSKSNKIFSWNRRRTFTQLNFNVFVLDGREVKIALVSLFWNTMRKWKQQSS